MSALVRTAIGDFRLEDAVALDDLTNDTFAEHLQPPLEALEGLAANRAQREATRRAPSRPADRNAKREAPARQEAVAAPNPEWAAVDPAGRLAAILFEKHPNQLWPARNFEA